MCTNSSRVLHNVLTGMKVNGLVIKRAVMVLPLLRMAQKRKENTRITY